ncbi:hypothetical protein VKT23_006707 [Stygiomarasmius scandens]|uniref:Uncharacterized protein n=1 Tax=Marasmiellus scandens TaxID=2682957 RepID=A0ABR1IN37_9AGAR
MFFSFLRTTLVLTLSATLFTGVTNANPISARALAQRNSTAILSPSQQDTANRVQVALSALQHTVDQVTPQIQAVIARPAQPGTNNGDIVQELQDLVDDIQQALQDAIRDVTTIANDGNELVCSLSGPVPQICQQVAGQVSQILQQVTAPFTPFLNSNGGNQGNFKRQAASLTPLQVQNLLNPLNNPISALLEAVFGILDGLLYIVDDLVKSLLFVLDQLTWGLVVSTLQL